MRNRDTSDERVQGQGPLLNYWQRGIECCDEEWEQAYARFESTDEEINKFRKRYRKLGVNYWPRSLCVVELFCGRGNSLKALELLGFSKLEGVDLSPALLQQYRGPASMYVGDCRQLRFQDESKDLVIIQGGLHHLPRLPDDLLQVLAESHRILKSNGRILIVEPWLTPFLRIVHAMCNRRILRKTWGKLNALGSMIDREKETYDQWLRRPSDILHALDQIFVCEKRLVRFGKILYVGKKGART